MDLLAKMHAKPRRGNIIIEICLYCWTRAQYNQTITIIMSSLSGLDGCLRYLSLLVQDSHLYL